ncbi:MAG: hypothetical protein SFX73_10815 [Kofleriaceae bacterium]|nr:hypothetical protein [Kofleriaceae bacterium]
MVTRAALVIALLAGHAAAQAPDAPAGPPSTLSDTPPPQLQAPSDVLRAGNAAATAGDWAAVAQLVEPLVHNELPDADRAEAYRLAGLAAFFLGRREQAEHHFLAYLRLDLDAQLDSALYPAEAIIFFNDVKAKHSAELRARRPRGKRWALNLLPPLGQLQNGERTKGLVVGGLLAGFFATNITTYVLLRRWCSESDRTCDDPTDRVQGAQTARSVNLITGIGTILTYAYGVIDGVRVYKRQAREHAIAPYISTTPTSGFIGVAGQF